MNDKYIRRGNVIHNLSGGQTTYPSVNKAKKASVALQRAGKGLGKGDLAVGKKRR